MKFIILAGFSALFFVILELLYKFSNCGSINPDLFVTAWFIISGFVTIPYFLYRNYHKEHIPNQIIFIIVIMGLLSLVGNLFYWNACKNMKNPGITRAVCSGVIIMLLSILTAITLKKYLSYIQSFSILLIIVGISLLLISSDD
jgi:uncharacterized membrane protein